MTPSGHNWVQGQGSGPRLADKLNQDEEVTDAMGNKVCTWFFSLPPPPPLPNPHGLSRPSLIWTNANLILTDCHREKEEIDCLRRKAQEECVSPVKYHISVQKLTLSSRGAHGPQEAWWGDLGRWALKKCTFGVGCFLWSGYESHCYDWFDVNIKLNYISFPSWRLSSTCSTP